MVRKLFFAYFILFLSSCAIFKSDPTLKGTQVDELLNSVQVLGEGRGRLGLDKQQYLFSYEAVLKEEDWILAVSVPIHGEEVMVLHHISAPAAPVSPLESFELRIQRELNARLKKSELKAETYIRELRSLIRFSLAPKFSLKRTCIQNMDHEYECSLDKEVFHLKVSEKKLLITKHISDTHSLELLAENLTGSFFNRTNFHFKTTSTTTSLMSLELFWK